MKKFNVVLAASAMALALAGCTSVDGAVEDAVNEVVNDVQDAVDDVKDGVDEVVDDAQDAVDDVVDDVQDAVNDIADDPAVKSEGVMTYAEYVAAEVDAEVVIECYVQATQSWWDNKISVYAADVDGGYFIYNMECSEEDAAKLVEGTKIKVTGYRAEWAGEVEVAEGATFEFEDGTYVATATDVTEFVGTDDLANYMNQKVCFADMTVKAVSYKNEQPGDDIYVTLTKDDTDVEFCLEYYLNGSDEEFYDLVGNLEEGATVDVECFLYWYEGADGHLTAVVVK